jgi:hypothetical protein
MYANVKAARKGDISQGKKAIFTEIEVPGCLGSDHWEEDARLDREAVQDTPQLIWALEEGLP